MDAKPAVPAADAGLALQNEHEEKVRWFSNHLHLNRDEWQKKIENELANKRFRVPIELRSLEMVKPGLSQEVLNSPVKYLQAWEEGLLAFLREVDEKTAKSLKAPLKLDITGSFGRNHVTPRGMTSATLQKLMCVEGIVTKAGARTPKLLQSMHVHKDKVDGHVESRDHRDQTAFVNTPGLGAMPNQDAEGNELVIEVGLSVYKDMQKFIIQEAPENSPPGQIPRSVEVVCEGDLADRAKPGDRVQVVGVYKSFPPPAGDFTNGVFPSRIIATNVTLIKDLIEAPFVSDDVRNIKRVAAREDAFALLSRSVAPSICGHEKVKSGLLLQMVGGTEKNLPNGTHLRGDINVLLVGDPSCGKSQMLRFVMNTANLAISTTGRGSSGVGLTAAMTREPGSRDFQLEAGAMVLADRGTICIDEFDKMSQADRVAIHEAMEQQCVTIAKAGMHVQLNARCSVLAAANPIYGNFEPELSLSKNIGLPDSLLSRFDLIFVVRDLTTEEIDRKIATQVLRQAMYRPAGDSRRRGVEQIHSSILERRQEASEADAKSPEATEVYRKKNSESDPDQLEVDFLRKYLRFCRRLKPKLSEEAQAQVAEKYVDMRMRYQTGMDDLADPEANRKPRLAVTTRTLEALIRLATAHAKLKLRQDFVQPEDVQEAYRLMLSAREEEVPDLPGSATAESGDGPSPPGPPGAPAASAGAAVSAAGEPQQSGRKRPRDEEADAGGIAPTRYAALKTLVARTFAQVQRQELSLGELRESVTSLLGPAEAHFSEEEFEVGLAKMEEQNKIMLTEAGDTVILIS